MNAHTLFSDASETGPIALTREGGELRSHASDASVRELAKLKLWAAFSSGSLLAASAATVAPFGASIYTFAPTAALCLIISAMAGGNRRFGDAARDTGMQFWLNAGLSLAGLALIIWLGVTQHSLPAYPALLVGLTVFAVIGLNPLRQLMKAREAGVASDDDTESEAVGATAQSTSATARVGTALFALAYGGLIAIMGAPRGLDTIHLLLLLVTIATTVPSPWSLTRSARTWKRSQWRAFGVTLVALVFGAACMSLSEEIALPLTIVCGGVAAAALLFNAFSFTPGVSASRRVAAQTREA